VQGDSAFELADAFCSQARVRIDALFRGLWRNADAINRGLAEKVLEGCYIWAEAGVLEISDAAPWIAEAAPGPSSSESVHHRIR
jgi:hypothetical protein